MTNFVQVLKMCESANGAGSKKVIQDALAQLDEAGQHLMYMAMNPYMVFGIKQYNMPKAETYINKETNYNPLVFALCKCAERELTGKAARMAVEEALSYCTEEDAPYFARIVDKDPRGGFSIATYNKVHPSRPIPDFAVMLADTCKTEEEFDQYITFPCIADVKYDGQRTLAFVDGINPVVYRARSGKLSSHLDGLFDEELNALRHTLGYDFVIDGEAFAGTFTETMNAKKSGNDTAKANMKLHVFNILPMTEWVAGKSSITLEENRQLVIRLFTGERITPSKSRIVNSYREMIELCNHVIDVEKQEGLILKRMAAFYEWKRSLSWCKVKRFYPADGRIIGFYYGEPKTKLANTIGGAVVAGYTDCGTYYETCVGSGFLELPNVDRPEMPTRADIMKDMRSWIGKTAVLKFQEITSNKNKVHRSLRFATIELIRDDKIVELPDDAVLHFPDRRMIEV